MRLTSADFVSPNESLDPNAFMDPYDLADLRRLAGIPAIGESANTEFTNTGSSISPVGSIDTTAKKRQIEKENGIQPGDPAWFQLWFDEIDGKKADLNKKLVPNKPNTLFSKNMLKEAVDPAIPLVKRKKRNDINHAIYVITNIITGEQYVGITAIRPNLKMALRVRIQKHVQRARCEEKDWGLCKNIRDYGSENFTFGLLEIVRGKRPAHVRELEIIRANNPTLNTFR